MVVRIIELVSREFKIVDLPQKKVKEMKRKAEKNNLELNVYELDVLK